MRIINKRNFFPIVSVVFTILVLSKVLLEAIVQNVFGGYQENLVLMFLLSLLATLVLSQHYRFQSFPLLVVMLLQYLMLIGAVIYYIFLFFEIRRVDQAIKDIRRCQNEKLQE